jgi:hypothetical protein
VLIPSGGSTNYKQELKKLENYNLVLELSIEDLQTKSENAIRSFVFSTALARWNRLPAVATITGEHATWEGGEEKFRLRSIEEGPQLEVG